MGNNPKWLSDLYEAANEIKNLELYFGKLEECFDYVLQKGELPKSISLKPNSFASALLSKTVKPILSNNKITDENLQIVLKYFSLLIKYSHISLKKNFNMFLEIPENMLIESSNLAQFCGTKFFEPIYKCISRADIFSFIVNALNSSEQQIDSVEKLKTYTMILIPSIKYKKNITFIEASDSIVKNIIQIMNDNFRETQAQVVFDILEKIIVFSENEELSKTFLVSLFNIIQQCIKCNIFDKQLISLKCLRNLIFHSTLNQKAYTFVVKNLSTIHNLQIRAEFTPLLADIYSILAEKGELQKNVFESLWEKKSVLSDTDLELFFSILISIFSKVTSDNVNIFLNIIFTKVNKTKSYLYFLLEVAKAIEKNTNINNEEVSSRSIKSIKKMLIKISEKIKRPRNEADLILNEMRAISISSADFEKLIKETIKAPKEFKLLFDSLDRRTIENNEISAKIIRSLLEVYPNETDVIKELINDIIIKINNSVSKKKNKLNKDIINMIFSLLKYDTIFLLIRKLINSETISASEFLSALISEDMKSFYISGKCVDLIEAIFKVDQLKELPFENEKFLWYLCSVKSYQKRIHTLIVNIYSNNDSNSISDEVMMNAFFSNWAIYFKKYNYPPEFISLLSSFIMSIESTEYIEICHHMAIPENDMYLITIGNEKVKVEPETTIYSLLRKLKRDNYFQYSFKYRSSILEGKSTIKSIAFTNDVEFTLVEVPIEKIRQRSVVPHKIFFLSSACDILFDELKKNEENDVLGNLLNYLPTNPKIMKILDELNGKSDFSNFLPEKYPRIFLYHLEAIFQQEKKCPKELLIYLVEIGLKIPYDRLLVSILDNIIHKWTTEEIDVESTFNSLYKVIDLCLNQKNSLCKALNTSLDLGYRLTKKKLHFPHKYCYFVNILLNSDLKDVRYDADFFFSRVDVPFNIYLDSLSERCSSEFFDSLNDHIKENNDKLGEILMSVLKKGYEEEGHLICINNFIDKDYFSEKNQELVFITLYKRYLKPSEMSYTDKKFQKVSEILVLSAKKKYKKLKVLRESLFLKKKEWNIDGDIFSIKKQKYVGLKNMGATCFLNSVTQQLFANIGFRNLVFSYCGNDEFTSSFQDLFARLRFSILNAETTNNFIDQITWDGEKMDSSRQQDGCEYLLLLFDKLENELTAASLNSLFQVKITSYIESMDGQNKISKSKETYLVLPLDVENSKDLEESLENFSKPEFLVGENGYKIDTGRIDVKRYSIISEYPNYLIIQLKRFQYNYSTWKRFKLTKLFKFPIEMEKKGKRLSLTGIVVHHGTADKGHYFSYIKIDGNWFCFNDSNVKSTDEKTVIDSGSKDGYLLFYSAIEEKENVNERIKKRIIKYNQDINKKRLFCSKQFFKIMSGWVSDSQNISIPHITVVIKYVFYILPFCNKQFIEKKSQKIFNRLTECFKNDENVLGIIPCYLNCNAMMGCPVEKYRDMIADIILLSFKAFRNQEFFKSILNYTQYVADYPKTNNQYMKVLYSIVSKFKHYEMTSNEPEEMFKTLIDSDINEMNERNFDYLLEILLLRVPSEQFMEYVISDETLFGYLLKSKTDISIIIKFVQFLFEKDNKILRAIITQRNNFPKLKEKFSELISSISSYEDN